MKKILRVLVGAIFIGAAVGIALNVTVHAAESDRSEAIKQKWIMTLYNQCFSDGYENKTISVTGKSASSGMVVDSVFDEGVGKDKMFLPSAGFFSGMDGETISCREAYEYALGYMGVTNWEDIVWGSTDLTIIADLLGRSGYVLGGDGGKISLNATVTPLAVSATGEKDSVLSALVGGMWQYYIPSWKIPAYNATLTLRNNGSKWVIDSRNNFAYSFATVKSNVLTIDARQGNGGAIEEVKNSTALSNDIGEAYEALTSLIGENIFIVPSHCSKVNSSNTAYCWVVFNNVSMLDGGEFVYDSTKREKGEYMLDDDERYDLYYYYFDVVVPGGGKSASCTDTKDDTMQDVNLKKNGKWVKYYFKKSDLPLERSFKDLYGGSTRDVTLADIIEWFNGFKAEEECDEDSDPDPSIDPTGPLDGGDAEADEVNCFNAAGSLGWILCPIISFTQHTINAIYGSIVQNFLVFRAEWLNIDGQGAQVYAAWQVFQSFANIIFVIVLLVVIFSQLTGVGIDNLGIKRVLPKLIVAAILINLSYFICMLFVDISNITGVGFNRIFSDIVVSIDPKMSASTGAQVLTTVVTAAVAGAVGFLAFNPVTVGIFGSVIVVPLVLGLIATLIGVLFFFILLGTRQAAIIVLVAISPVAFACYMLPNTKTIFDKWLKIFEALLLLFPICGLMMGGSAFASKILQTVDSGFLGQLIAMLVGVVPFFFIPTLLRGAFSAMGNLGARISGFGQNISRGIGKAAVNSDAMKDFQTRMRAGVDRNGKLTWAGRRRGEIARGNSRLSRIPGMQRMARRVNARGMGEYTKYMKEMKRQERLNDPGYLERFERAQEMELEKEQFATEMDIVNDQTNKGNLLGKTYDIFSDALGEYNAATTDEDRKAAAFKMKAAAEVAGGDSYKAKDFIKRIKEDSTNGKLSGGALESIAKQISTGENAKKYRATDALGFEYMSQITNGDSSVRNADGSYKTYEQWASDSENVHKAIDNHIVESNDLMNQSTDSLSEILRRVKTNGYVADKQGKNGETIHINDRETLAGLARDAEVKAKNGTGKQDTTKDPYIGSIQELAPPPSSGNSDMQPGQSYSARGNTSNEELEKLRDHFNRKVNEGTATAEDRQTLNRINDELDIRQNGYSSDQGTPA